MASVDSGDTSTLIIRQPDDWHVHLRDGDMMEAVVPYTARQFARAIVMPNLTPPVTTVAAAEAYRERILAAVPEGVNFTPLITCYLTDGLDPAVVKLGFEKGMFTAAKLYPAHATTNSSHGVTDVKNIYPVLEVMQKIGMPFLVHGEVTDSHVDIFDREAVFIDRTMKQVVADFPGLKVVFEHITTAEAAAFVLETGANVGATVTPQHLMYNRNAMLVGGIRPHFYCLPIIKREEHRAALRKAVTSGSPKFFLGTDSAPHIASTKETSCGCAGIFNAPHALESYAQVFDEEGALHLLEAFASENGPKFYGLSLNERRVVLKRTETEVPASIPAAGTEVVPFHAGETLPWHFAGFETV